MAKRFTDTDIWEQDWFVSLPNKYKMFWFYIKDKCDDCGVWRPNKEMFQRIITEPINLNEFLVFVNTDEKHRILVLDNGRWFLRDYFFFQYGDNFNPHSPVHRGVLKRLVTHGIHVSEINKVHIGKLVNADIQTLREIAYQYPKDTLVVEYGYPINRVKDKDKDKDNKEIVIVGSSIKEGEEKKISSSPIGSEKVTDVARKVWDDEMWRNNVCMGNSLQPEELKKWMAKFNASVCNDTIANFGASTYKKMIQNWISKQMANGITLNGTHQSKASNSAPLQRYHQ